MNCRRIDGAKFVVAEIVLVDQSPIGRTPRSNPVTYIKAFDAIRRDFLGDSSEAKRRNYSSGHFFLQHSRRTLRGLPGRRHSSPWRCSSWPDVELVLRGVKGGTRSQRAGVLEVALSRQERA